MPIGLDGAVLPNPMEPIRSIEVDYVGERFPMLAISFGWLQRSNVLLRCEIRMLPYGLEQLHNVRVRDQGNMFPVPSPMLHDHIQVDICRRDVLRNSPLDVSDVLLNHFMRKLRRVHRCRQIVDREIEVCHSLTKACLVRSEEHTSELQSQSNLV